MIKSKQKDEDILNIFYKYIYNLNYNDKLDSFNKFKKKLIMFQKKTISIYNIYRKKSTYELFIKLLNIIYNLKNDLYSFYKINFL